MKNYALSVKNLNVRYNLTPVISDITLDLPQQVLCCVVGPNGAGKSSFIKALIDLVPRDSGTVKFFDSSAKKQLLNIAYVAQRQEVDWNFPITVREVVEMGRLGYISWWQRLGKQDNIIISNAMERIGILDLADRQISELSGGQQQRVFIARALAQQASFYLLDEPFAGIDINTEKSLIDLFNELVKDGVTIVAVHHDVSTIKDYFSHAILLNQYLVACGTVEDVITKPLLKRTFSSQDTIQSNYNQTVKKVEQWPNHS